MNQPLKARVNCITAVAFIFLNFRRLKCVSFIYTYSTAIKITRPAQITDRLILELNVRAKTDEGFRRICLGEIVETHLTLQASGINQK